MSDYIDVTEKWIKQAKPKKGNINFINYAITLDDQKFDFTNSTLGFDVDDDFYVGTWFKNTIWGNCRFQPAVNNPQGIRTADLRIFHCPFIKGKTIEIKTISSGRKDGIVRRLKEAKGQSENVLVDVTSFPYDEDIIKHEIRKYFTKHETIKIIAVKKYNDLLFVWQKV